MRRVFAIVFVLFAAVSCRTTPQAKLEGEALKNASWSEIEAAARGTEVYWMHWRGDPSINQYTDGYVAREMLSRYGITLKTVSGQGAELFSRLSVEAQAGRTSGSTDAVWINGETFHQLRKANLLYGPFLSSLPNASKLDLENPIIANDFEQPTEGFECPWGSVQLALIYHQGRVSSPPRTVEALRAWIKAHPGRFTYDQSFTGVTFMKTLLYALSGGAEVFQGKFDSTLYEEKSKLLWEYLNDIKPYLWQSGKVYPESVAKLHFLFSNGEIDFTMSNNDAEVDNKILQGVLPRESRAMIFEEGTIANAHYIGIPINSANKAGALVLCNFLISEDAQYEKMKPEVWADGSVLSPEKLSEAWQSQFRSIPNRVAALPRDSIRRYAKPEIRPEYHERILEDWRSFVLKAGK